MHYCVVQIRIKFLSNRFDWFYSCFFQYGHHLLVDFFHTFYERSSFLFLSDSCQTTFEVINNRKYFFYDTFCTGLKHLGFFFFCSLTEVIELSHLSSDSVCKLFDFLIFFIFLLFLLRWYFGRFSAFFFSGFRFFCCSLLSFFYGFFLSCIIYFFIF